MNVGLRRRAPRGGNRGESPANERHPRRRAARLVRTLAPASWPAAGRPPQTKRVGRQM